MIQTVQFALTDAVYARVLRDSLLRSGPWHVVSTQAPDLTQKGVLVLDEEALERLPLPLPNPERFVLITCKDPLHLSRAWDAGIVSVVSADDAPATVILAIMAAALRVSKGPAIAAGAIPAPDAVPSAPISPEIRPSHTKRCKTP